MRRDAAALLVDVEPRQLLLSDRNGQPVWPVYSDADFTALQSLAARALVPIRLTKGVPQGASSGREQVVAIGEEAIETARLYAHLTSRRFQSCNEESAILANNCASVVVTTPDHLSDQLLSSLYPLHPRGAAPGIICADAHTLRSQALLRSAASMLDGPPPSARFLAPIASFGQFEQDTLWVAGGRTDASEIRHALTNDSGVLGILTHSDGIDAFLGRHLTLCSRDGANRAAPLPPRCVETGFCHRANLPFDEACQSGSLLGASEIRAWLFIWAACWGIQPPNRIVHTHWSLAPPLLSNTAVAAILTPWMTALLNSELVLSLLLKLLSGRPVGKALTSFHCSPGALRTGVRFALYGDPRSRVRLGGATVLKGFQPSAYIFGGQTATIHQIEFLRLIENKPKPLIDAINAYEREGDTVQRESGRSAGDQMRSDILAFLAEHGPLLVDIWASAARISVMTYRTERCIGCDHPDPCLSHYIAEFRPTPAGRLAPPRRLVLCPVCGVIEDTPVHWKLRMAILDDRVWIDGDLPREHWHAILVAKAQRREESRQWTWPSEDNGAPIRLFSPAGWPAGPLDVGVLIMMGASVGVLSRRARVASRASLVHSPPQFSCPSQAPTRLRVTDKEVPELDV